MSKQTVSAGTVPEFDIHDRLRKARDVVGLDQQTLGDEIDVSRNTVVNYENASTKHLKALVPKQWAPRKGGPDGWPVTGEEPPQAPGGREQPPRLETNQQPSGYT